MLSEGEVAAALAAERAALAASPTTPATPSPAPTASAVPGAEPTGPASAPVVRTWSVDGGAVSVSCVQDVVSLEYATPSSGWRVDAKERGPGARVLVELEREGTETFVQAVCVAGTPEFSLVADDADGAEDDGGDSGDDGGADGADGEDRGDGEDGADDD